ncbi:hypothetical protein DYB37_002417 [Aphanomyces astaci]|uniref:Uncharacterized protein n=2 Tax=Aphanomyces astaci TaxID=112090 RepID=A0A397DRF7_APHAT|nr:hypothetical protein DYB36_000641 [Aphanomyces astaci]RHY66909.1 hypothetical protein DYB30_001515 [Aphanomyces astaci]RHY91313.1 hypothetical protein DYB35_003388 [Aphanomyces astaci]RHZ11052.1 hypothetical protein DYB31_004921 [Aphanomyces astaci]RHZ33566.1 hypothetical protein DYB37_002417 [Aphanomyces astaci]
MSTVGGIDDVGARDAALHGGFHVAQGHFTYHPSPDSDKCIFEHFHRSAESWAAFTKAIEGSTRHVKVIYFIRHAEGEHNAAKVRHGAEVWFRDIACTDLYLDALLTAKGEAAATVTAARVEAELDRGMPLQKIIVSPMRRTLQTATSIFRRQLGHVPFVALELCRETIGMHTCDKRSAISTLSPLFPSVDFSNIRDDVDTLWRPDLRESLDDIQSRAVTFLRQLHADVPDTFIAVVSHVGFITACLRVLHMPEYRVGNCELVPVVLDVHDNHIPSPEVVPYDVAIS